MKASWKKCHSVTHGGKSYFWFRNSPTRSWITWNRNLAQWELEHETRNGARWVQATAPSDKALLRLR